MHKHTYLTFAIGAVSLLLIDVLVAIPAEANVFTCRASALRVNLPLAGIFEPVVANSKDIPCATEAKSLASAKVTLPLGILPPLPLTLPLGSVISATLLSANTDASASKSVNAEGKVASASILGLLTAGVLDATARVDSVGGVCKLSGKSSVLITSTLVPGLPINTVIANPLNVTVLSVPLVGSIVLHLNEKIVESGVGSGKITQRALRLEIKTLLLTTNVVVAEAIADFANGNPCSL